MTRILFALLALLAVAGLLYVLTVTFTPSAPARPPVYVPSEDFQPEADPDPDLVEEGEDEGDAPAPENAAFLSGRVVRGGDGVPVGGVAVTAWIRKFRRTVLTDDEGAFDFGGVPVGSVRVRVRSAEFVDPPPRVERLEFGRTYRIEIRLAAGSAVVGHVVDRDTGDALEGIRLSVSGSRQKVVTTGPGGDYRLEGLAMGLASIQAEGNDYPMMRVGVLVPEGAGEVQQDVSLLRGATASGIVTDSAGKPVSGATVGTGFSRGKKVTCGPDGRFTLRALPVKRILRFTAEADGYVAGRSEDLRFKSGEEFDGVTIFLSRGGTVVGQVLLADRSPAVGATVRLVPVERGSGVVRLPTATTGPDGRFEINSVIPGDHRATATLRGTLGGSADVLDVIEDGVTTSIVIQLGVADSITGMVTDEQGRPVKGAQLSARPAEPIPGGRYVSARSAEDGRFSLDGLTPGLYRVGVRPQRGGLEAAFVEVPSGTADVSLTLPAPGEISGRVLQPDGQPVTSCSLRLSPVSGGAGSVFTRVRDPDGNFSLSGLSPGEYRVSASSPDGSNSPGTVVLVASGGRVPGIVLTLMPPGVVTGRVLSETGRPIVGAQVHASTTSRAGSSGRGSARSDRDGGFELKGLRPGTYRIQASKDGMIALTEGIVVLSGVVATADIRFRPTGGILVTVLDESGVPIPGASVHVRSTGGIFVPVRPAPIRESVPPTERAGAARDSRRKATQTNEDGVIHRDGIPEGEVTLSVYARGFELGRQNIMVSAGRTMDVQFVLRAGAAKPAVPRKVR